MTTFSTNSGFNHTTTAQQQAWVTESIQGLLQVGITQTTDTGQMANPCTTVFGGAPNTEYGYYVFRFNDPLQSTTPIFFRMGYGNGGSAATPRCSIIVGTGSNGSGTITGTVMTQVAAFAGGSIAGIGGANNLLFITRYCYIPAQGVLWIGWKYGGSTGGFNSPYETWGGFVIFRSVDQTGAPTADTIHFLGNSSSTIAQTNPGTMQIINHNTGTASMNNAPLYNSGYWTAVPCTAGQIITTTSGDPSGLPQCFPIFQYLGSATSSGYGISNAGALAVLPEQSLFSTLPYTILGSTTLTYMSAGSPFGLVSFTGLSFAAPNYTVLLPWQ